MPFKGECFSARLRVPNFDGLVGASTDDALAIGTECHAHHKIGMPFKGEYFLARLCIPHLDRSVLASADDALAIRAKSHT